MWGNSVLLRAFSVFAVFWTLIPLDSRSEGVKTLAPVVIRIAIRGSINPATVDYLNHGIEEALLSNAALLLLELDTPGGLVSSVRSMAQAVETSPVPIVVYVSPAGAGATSAGALLLLASHVAAMAPGSTMGAAHPVGPGGAEIPGATGQKATHDVAAFARGLAEVRNRNRVAAEEIVERSRSFTAQEALDAGLIEVLAKSPEELLLALQGRKVRLKNSQGAFDEKTLPSVLTTLPVQWVPMTLGQKVLSTLAHPDVATLLMSIGGLLIYVELQTPGVGIAGGLGVVCLLASLTAYQLIPIRTTGLLLLVLGIVLFLAEVFVSTHGALALSGLVAFALGAIWLVDPSWSSHGVSPTVWIPAVVVMGGMALLIAFATARLKEQVIEARRQMGGGDADGLSGYLGQVNRVEGSGTGSREGEILIRGELWKFKCDSEVQVGDWVQVVQMSGFTAQVKRHQEAPAG